MRDKAEDYAEAMVQLSHEVENMSQASTNLAMTINRLAWADEFSELKAVLPLLSKAEEYVASAVDTAIDKAQYPLWLDQIPHNRIAAADLQEHHAGHGG